MLKFKNLVVHTLKESGEPEPWWDTKSVRLFHGTSLSKANVYQQTGIPLPKDDIVEYSTALATKYWKRAVAYLIEQGLVGVDPHNAPIGLGEEVPRIKATEVKDYPPNGVLLRIKDYITGVRQEQGVTTNSDKAIYCTPDYDGALQYSLTFGAVGSEIEKEVCYAVADHLSNYAWVWSSISVVDAIAGTKDKRGAVVVLQVPFTAIRVPSAGYRANVVDYFNTKYHTGSIDFEVLVTRDVSPGEVLGAIPN